VTITWVGERALQGPHRPDSRYLSPSSPKGLRSAPTLGYAGLMLSLFLAAARYKLYVAVAMAAFQSVYGQAQLPREAPEVADAIAIAVLEAPRELPGALQGVSLAATMAVYAVKETDLRKHPCARSKSRLCADGGLAGGYWQLHQPAGFSEDAREQAAAWVELIRQSVRICGNPTNALAMTLSGHCSKGLISTRSRLLAVTRALNTWNAEQTAERPPSASATVERASAAVAVPAAALAPAAGGSSHLAGVAARALE
jgi:hypothetical protein